MEKVFNSFQSHTELTLPIEHDVVRLVHEILGTGLVVLPDPF